MKLLNTQEIPFKDQKFQLEFTGEELVRLWWLSFDQEAGNQHPTESERRFCGMIRALFPEVPFQKLSYRLVKGKIS